GTPSDGVPVPSVARPERGKQRGKSSARPGPRVHVAREPEDVGRLRRRRGWSSGAGSVAPEPPRRKERRPSRHGGTAWGVGGELGTSSVGQGCGSSSASFAFWNLDSSAKAQSAAQELTV